MGWKEYYYNDFKLKYKCDVVCASKIMNNKYTVLSNLNLIGGGKTFILKAGWVQVDMIQPIS